MTESWVALYHGTGNFDDKASAVAVDSSGNVYVTGASYGLSNSYDYSTIKYDSSGNQVWVARYDGGNGYDSANAIAVDSSGNVYVTGTSTSSNSHDYVTIKYDANGNEMWAARYNGGNSIENAPSSLVVDTSGNVYVTGDSGSASERDYATVKYDSQGNELWVARYGPGNSYDYAYSLQVDALGNVYVTGTSYGSGSDYDYATIKYDSNGKEVWVARYNGPGNGPDAAHSLAVDSSGNVYVTGWSYGSGSDYDYATIKYDSNGKEVWVARYNGPVSSSDYAMSLALDSSGNVYVAGSSNGEGSSYDYATIKYDSNGNQAWVARYNGPGNGSDTANSLAVDRSGNVYVTGSSGGGGGALTDYATIKYDSNGNQVWEARFNGSGSGTDYARALALDTAGNVYVTGWSTGSAAVNYAMLDYATIKYSQNCGNIVQTITPPAISTVAPGGVLNFSSTETNNCNFTVQFSVQPYIVRPDGTTIWLKKVGTSLSAGETRTHPFSWTIPMNSEQGNFIWGVVLTDASGNQIDQDTFPFTVVAAQ
jgi:uncharacterized delta-60 repeat protein